jgi:hypothetical protein
MSDQKKQTNVSSSMLKKYRVLVLLGLFYLVWSNAAALKDILNKAIETDVMLSAEHNR